MTTTNESDVSARRRALICGVGGQDGAYLAKLLVGKGYEVVGTSRDATAADFLGLSMLGVASDVRVVTMGLNDFRSVLQTISRFAPDEVYNLAGQSSVGLSFEQPVETIESIALGTLNLLEAIRFVERPIRFYSAGSSECFGDTGSTPASETTPFRPRSPYAVAKACAHNLVANYREAYRMHACTGILFNHESPLRPERFVTQKIVRAACRIAHGSKERLRLGNLAIHRDWGSAPEYVEVMWLMMQQERAEDYVIATGKTVSLEHFANRAFAHFDLDWRDHIECDEQLLRPSDVQYGAADPTRAAQCLGWRARWDVDQVIDDLCQAATAALAPKL